MGAGASALPSNTSESVTKALQEKHQELTHKGIPEADIQIQLSELYTILIAAEHHLPLLPSDDTSNIKSKISDPSPKPALNRRRSFENKVVKPAADSFKAKEPLTLSVSQSVPTIETVATVDHWDSVTEQPFCDICKMAFKSMSFLERHVKYSDLHKTTLAKFNASEGLKKPETATKIVAAPSAVVNVKGQVEGQHYKLLYNGSKLFWRTQENVDFHIYYHILSHCVEVIAYDTTKGKEFNRLYFNYDAVIALLPESYFIEAQSKLKREPISPTNASNTNAKEDQDDDTKRVALTTYLVSRLQKIPGDQNISFVRLASDQDGVSPQIPNPPSVLMPVSVTRRRRTNDQEINTAMSDLAISRLELTAATEKAEKIAGLIFESANIIISQKWWASFNPVRRKWIWAIRRVIRQKLVAETKVVLAALNEKKKVAQVNAKKEPPKKRTATKHNEV